MLARLYEPILWRALKVANANGTVVYSKALILIPCPP